MGSIFAEDCPFTTRGRVQSTSLGNFLGTYAAPESDWELWTGTQTATTTATGMWLANSTATSTISNMNIPSIYKTWVRRAGEDRFQQITRAWTYTEIEQAQSADIIATTIQIQQHAREQAGRVYADIASSGTVMVQWETLYGQHMAESAERIRARAALERHANQHTAGIEKQIYQRAEALLVQHLTPQQRADYQRNKWFIVDGKSGRRYRVRHGITANVDALRPNGTVEHRLCAVYPDGPVPDHLLAQKLHLELAEQEFLRVAIRHAA